MPHPRRRAVAGPVAEAFRCLGRGHRLDRGEGGNRPCAGADEPLYGRDYDFKDQVLALTDGEGVDLAFDGLGAKTLMNTIGSLRRGGTVVAIGAASGPIPAIEPTVLTPKALRLAGGSVFSFVADPAELRKRAADVVTGIQEGWLKLENATEYPLDGAADAHADLENRRAKGKLYLKA